MIQTKIVKQYDKKGLSVHNTEILEDEAKIAVEFVTKWGVTPSIPDGGKSGYTEVRMMTPEELAIRALDTAKVLMDEARKRGLVHYTCDINDFDVDKGSTGTPSN
jgi:hypothetical protein